MPLVHFLSGHGAVLQNALMKSVAGRGSEVGPPPPKSTRTFKAVLMGTCTFFLVVYLRHDNMGVAWQKSGGGTK